VLRRWIIWWWLVVAEVEVIQAVVVARGDFVLALL
jgi:hypothetical protein